MLSMAHIAELHFLPMSDNGDLCEMRCGGPDDEDEKIGCHKVGVLLLLLLLLPSVIK